MESCRRTPTTIRATQDCSKLGTTMGWKWFSRQCEGQHQVEPDPCVHNLPSRRLHYWRHYQRNFMIAHFQIRNNRSSSCVTFSKRKLLGPRPDSAKSGTVSLISSTSQEECSTMSGTERWASHRVNTKRASPREHVYPIPYYLLDG